MFGSLSTPGAPAPGKRFTQAGGVDEAHHRPTLHRAYAPRCAQDWALEILEPAGAAHPVR
jgi:hypothetical protein